MWLALALNSLLLASASPEYAAVVEWGNSIKSFDGVYRLTQESVDNTEWNWEYTIEYRYQGANEYISIDGLNEQKSGMFRETHSLYNGIVTTRVDKSNRLPTGDVLGQGNSLPIPSGSFLTPKEVLGWHDGVLPINDVFDSEHATVIFYEGEKYLSLQKFKGSRFLDVALTEDNVPKRLEWVVRDNRPEEEIQELCNCPPFSLRLKLITLELSEMVEIDSVLFPLAVTRTKYRYDRELQNQYLARYDSGEITANELTLLRMARKPEPYLSQRMILQSAKINQPLTEADFTVGFPAGSTVVNKRDGGVIKLTEEIKGPGLMESILGALTANAGRGNVREETFPVGTTPIAPPQNIPPPPPPVWYRQATHPGMLSIYTLLCIGVLAGAFLLTRR